MWDPAETLQVSANSHSHALQLSQGPSSRSPLLMDKPPGTPTAPQWGLCSPAAGNGCSAGHQTLPFIKEYWIPSYLSFPLPALLFPFLLAFKSPVLETKDYFSKRWWEIGLKQPAIQAEPHLQLKFPALIHFCLGCKLPFSHRWASCQSPFPGNSTSVDKSLTLKRNIWPSGVLNYWGYGHSAICGS